jgi:uridylate kinase
MPPTRRSVRAPVVLSVGGSILRTGERDVEYLRELADLLRRLAPRIPLVITTGGGRAAREYIDIGRSLGLTEIELDELGIDVTRLHARLLAALVGPPAPAHPPTTLTEAVREAHRVSPVILGGTEPGHTTDGVAALMAVRLRAARVVNATAVAGLYDKDPALHGDARRLPMMHWPEFLDLVHGRGRSVAGQKFVFDALGAEQLARARLPLLIVDGRDLANLERALEGKACVGTRID